MRKYLLLTTMSLPVLLGLGCNREDWMGLVFTMLQASFTSIVSLLTQSILGNATAIVTLFGF